MRTTFNAMYREASAGINTAAERLAEFQRQVGTGKKVDKPSDDPSGASTSIGQHAELASIEQYTRATTSVGSRLTVVDTILADIYEKVTAAQTTALSARGSNQGTAQREAAAQSLESLRDTLFENFNTQFQGSYIFGGTNALTAPFQKDASGNILPYAGTSAEVSVEIDKNRSATVAFDGGAIANVSATENVFDTMNDLIAAARAGDNAVLGAGIETMKDVLSRIATAQTRVGADMTAIDDQRMRLGQAKVAAMKRIDQVEAANMAEAITGMTQSQAAYEAALGAAASMSRISLMDYLK
jgi:flagellar hook-associated protein 3 FlgL